MNGSLLDTNVPSELTKPKSDPLVEKWLDDADELLFFSVISLAKFSKASPFFRKASVASELQPWRPFPNAGEFWPESASLKAGRFPWATA
jgi:hypothetical protein